MSSSSIHLHSHTNDIKLDSLRRVYTAFKFMIILQNRIRTNDRNSEKSKYEHKLPKQDVVTMQIRYSVNQVLGSVCPLGREGM